MMRFTLTNYPYDDSDWIQKDDAVEFVLENYYDEVREAVFEQEAENRTE